MGDNKRSVIKRLLFQPMLAVAFFLGLSLSARCVALQPIEAAIESFDVRGNNVVYTLRVGQNQALILENLTTTSAEKLPIQGWCSSPRFSRSGNQIYFVKETNSKGIPPVHSVYVYDIGSGRSRQLCSPPKDASYEEAQPLEDSHLILVRGAHARPYSLGGEVWDREDIVVLDLRSGNISSTSAKGFRHIWTSPGSVRNQHLVFVGSKDVKGRHLQQHVFWLDVGKPGRLRAKELRSEAKKRGVDTSLMDSILNAFASRSAPPDS